MPGTASLPKNGWLGASSQASGGGPTAIILLSEHSINLLSKFLSFY